MATNDILAAVSTDTGTNLLTQAEYVADAQRLTGNQPGIARSKLVNKMLRQSSLVVAALAQYVADGQATNVTDSLTPAALAALLKRTIQASSLAHAQVTGTANALLAAMSPTWTAQNDGDVVLLQHLLANTTTTPTLQVDALTARTIVKGANLPLDVGDIPGANSWGLYVYDGSLSVWVLLNPATATNTASTAGKGVIQLASSAEAQAGTDALKALTSATLRNGLNAGGSAPIYAARAFLNYNGVTAFARQSANFSSVTKNGTGDYTPNFATAMGGINYAVVATGTYGVQTATQALGFNGSAFNTGSFRVLYSFGGVAADCQDLCLAVFN